MRNEAHATKWVKTGAITPKTSQAMGAPSFRPTGRLGYWLLAIGYAERA
jgi:hypothetical protein